MCLWRSASPGREVSPSLVPIPCPSPSFPVGTNSAGRHHIHEHWHHVCGHPDQDVCKGPCLMAARSAPFSLTPPPSSPLSPPLLPHRAPVYKDPGCVNWHNLRRRHGVWRGQRCVLNGRGFGMRDGQRRQLPSQPIFLSKIGYICYCYDQKHNCTWLQIMQIPKGTILGHQTGTFFLGGQSKTDFLSNLTIFYPGDPCFGAKLSIFVAVLTKIKAVYGWRLYGYQ